MSIIWTGAGMALCVNRCRKEFLDTDEHGRTRKISHSVSFRVQIFRQ